MNRFRNLAFALAVTAGAVSMGAACAAKKNTELVVAVQTDLRIPKDLNAINIKIVTLGGIQFDQTFAVGPGGVHLPQTIGVVPNDDEKLQPVDITVTGQFGSTIDTAEDRVIRRVKVTFAKDRVGLVRMPLRFACYGKTDENACASEETCIAGKCVAVPEIQGADLPAFTTEAVFGAGGDNEKIGKCWSPTACLPSSAPLQKIGDCEYSLSGATEVDAGPKADGGGPEDAMAPPDGATPVDAGAGTDGGSSGGDDAALPPDAMPFMWKRFEDPSKVSVVVTSTKGLGFCDASGCKLPIDFDANEGWSWGNDNHTSIKLAKNLCDVLGGAQVLATDACETKTSELPFCDENAGGDDSGPVSDSSVPDSSMGGDSCGGGVKCEPGMCGPIPDGCGGMADCGGCMSGSTCDFGTHKCTSTTGDGGPVCPGMALCSGACTDLKSDPKNCGSCGHVCSPGSTCTDMFCVGTGADATPPPDVSCMPMTCAMVPGKCGPTTDGCGGLLDCMCPGGMTCMAGGCVPTSTDAGSCVPKTCIEMGAECGVQPDGCGGFTPPCGTCDGGATCGAAGPGKCGTGTCVPMTCTALGYNCGAASDGCGGPINCGVCTAPATCGGGGVPNHCGGSGDAGADADAGSDVCGMSPESPPIASTPFRQGWHLAGASPGTPMSSGPTLTNNAVGIGGTFTAATCSGGQSTFNGTTSYLSGADPLVATGTSLEVSAWVYLDPAKPPAANATLVSTLNGTKGFFVGADSAGKPTFVVTLIDGTTRAATAASATIASAGWFHFAGSAVAGKPIQLFSNGALLATGGTIDKALSPAPQIFIGRSAASSSGFWNGPIGEIRIYGN